MYKIDMLFHQTTNLGATTDAPVRSAGWSEGWYIDGTLAQVKAAVHGLCQIRATLLTQAASIVGQRFRLVGGGSTMLTTRYRGSQAVQSDVPQMAVLCSIQGRAVPNVRRFALRGIADARVVEGEYQPSSTNLASISAMGQWLDRSSFRFKGRNLSVGSSLIDNVTTGGVVLLEEPYVVVEDQYVNVSRAKDVNGHSVSARHRVAVANPPYGMTLATWTHGPTEGGRVSISEEDFHLVDGLTLNVSRVVVRKVGRSFFQYVGRRSNR